MGRKFEVVEGQEAIAHGDKAHMPVVDELYPAYQVLKAGPWTVPSSRMYAAFMACGQMPLFAIMSIVIGDFDCLRRIVLYPLTSVRILGVMYLPALHGDKGASAFERMRRIAKTLRNCWELEADRCYRIPAFLNYMRRLEVRVLNLFNDKQLFNSFCIKAGVPCAQAVAVNSAFEVPKFEFIVKPSGGAFGAEVRMFKWEAGALINSLTDAQVDPAALTAELRGLEGEVVVEERLVNADAIARLISPSAKALCTCRVMTVTDKADMSAVACLTCVLRLCTRADTAADNGAIFVAVDWEAEALKGPARNGFGETFPTHPLSGVGIDGYKIPGLRSVVQTALDWHARFALEYFSTPLHVMGWDVALTTNGPKIIELNEVGHPAFQIATGPWLDHPIAGRVFDATGGRTDFVQKTI